MQWSKDKGYQMGNLKPYIEEGQTMQWSKDKGYQRGNQKPYIEERKTMQWRRDKSHQRGIRSRTQRKDRQCNGEEIEDFKRVIRSHK